MLLHLKYFYPRSPCGERRQNYECFEWIKEFLSTLSLRRATDMKMWMIRASKNFYPRSPCGERRESPPPCGHPTTDFYPRSPCGERHRSPVRSGHDLDFYPRSPCGERPNLRQNQHQRKRISIHALLAESDQLTV